MSKKITLSEDGATAVVADAKLGDILTTVVSTDVAVTGMYGLLQRGGLFAAGMATQAYRATGSFNFLKAV